MDLIKKNIHTDRVKCKASDQITLEDDIIVSDSKPDADKLIFDRGIIKVEEIKTSPDHVELRGKLYFSVLYLAEDGERVVNSLEGSIPFQEQIFMEGVDNADTISYEHELEDLSIGLINPRKLSVRALLSFKVWVEELYDIESGVEIYGEQNVECRKKTVDLAEIAVQKKDVFRIKQELELPQNLPNVFTVIWNEVSMGEVQWKPQEDKISVQGELHVFVLYEGEGEEEPIRWYETTAPFSGVIDCYGCRDSMILEMNCQTDHAELEVRPDFDGEERILGIDMLLNLSFKLYEENKVELLSDVYGMQKELVPSLSPENLKCLLMKNNGKTKVGDKFKVRGNTLGPLQICHSNGEIQIEDISMEEKGVSVSGNVNVKVLYVTSEDREPFHSVKGSIPFTYLLEVPQITEDCSANVSGSVEQINVSMIDSEEVDVKVVLNINAMVFQNKKENIMSYIKEEELDMDKMGELPGMVAYVAKSGDSLWEIGKKYYVPISQIRETNSISGDLKSGDKILVIKSVSQ